MTKLTDGYYIYYIGCPKKMSHKSEGKSAPKKEADLAES